MRDHKNSYSTQAEAKRAIVESIWGTVPFARRESIAIPRETMFDGGIVVSADVNGDLVVFGFDNYGRLSARQPGGTSKPLVVKRACL